MIDCLLACVVADFVTGIIASCILHEVCSSIGYRGILKKMLMFVLVYLVWYISPSLMNSYALFDITVLFYICNEFFSIVENLTKCGVPLPKKLVSFIKKLEDDNNADNK